MQYCTEETFFYSREIFLKQVGIDLQSFCQMQQMKIFLLLFPNNENYIDIFFSSMRPNMLKKH